MEKNCKVGSGGSAYNGTKDQDVKEVFNESMSKHGLCMIPFDIQEKTKIDRWEEVDVWSKLDPKPMKTKQSVFTKTVVKYMLLHESGESTTVCGYGHGVDPQDKGAGKATTYAMKNALLYTFMTPVGKIDDTDTTHSNDIDVSIKKDSIREKIESCKNILELKSVYKSLTKAQQKEYVKVKDEMKVILS